MSDALWIKRGGALVPADPATGALLSAIKEGNWTRTSVPTLPRNPKHHRLMMAILNKVVEHTWPRFADIHALMRYLKLKSKMVDFYVVDGITVFELQSISFVSKDEAEFKAISEQWLAIICAPADEGGLMPGTDPEDLLRESEL